MFLERTRRRHYRLYCECMDGRNGSPGGEWPSWNSNSSTGLIVLNETSFGYINFTVCALLDEVMQGVSNGSAGVGLTSTGSNQSASGTPSGTATSSTRTATAANVKAGGILLLMGLVSAIVSV
jgi:hypothetical protein